MNSTYLIALGSTIVLLAVAGCGDPPSLMGQPCQVDEHCGPESGFDLTCDNDVPGGYCYVDSCDDGCPPGSLCTPDADGEGDACRQACDQVLDCREVIARETGKNAMDCAPIDPEADPDAEDVERTCVFSGN